MIEKTQLLNAFITVTGDLARKQSNESTQRFREGKSLGPLDGIPIAIKDNYCIAGIRTTCGSRMLQNYTPPYTATIVQRLLDRGVVLVGKTNMDEFAMGCGSVDSVFGPVRNPWGLNTPSQLTSGKLHSKNSDQSLSNDDFHIAGGSSGGSAVAVASGCALGALASDTGGSIRNPAALCGVVGVKPTYGLLSRHGLIPLVNSMDVPGFHARTTDDAALLFDAMIGRDPLDSTSVNEPIGSLSLPDNISVSGLRIGIPKEYHTTGMDTEIVASWQQTADLLANAGADVHHVSLPHTQYSIACYSVLNNCEVASNFARYDGIEYGHRAQNEESTEALFATSRHEGFNDTVRGRILAGNYFLLRKNYEKYFLHALKVRRLIAEDFRMVFKSGTQFLLSPVTIGPAPLYSQFTQKDEREQTALQDVCTQPANMAGIPAVSVPIQLSAAGLPISLQVMGPMYSDIQLLTLTKWIENNVMFPTIKCHDLMDANIQQTKHS